MRIIKRASQNIPREGAHGGAGARKVLATSEHTSGENLEAMTHGFLPAGAVFDWHNHEGVDEIMVVLKGLGVVSDEDGTYGYADGDTFIFPAGVQHRIENTSGYENEMIFVRVLDGKIENVIMPGAGSI